MEQHCLFDFCIATGAHARILYAIIISSYFSSSSYLSFDIHAHHSSFCSNYYAFVLSSVCWHCISLQFNTSDANAILVNTGTNDDPEKRLSGYYHFDAPSIIIIGQRIADVSSIDRSYVACIILFL